MTPESSRIFLALVVVPILCLIFAIAFLLLDVPPWSKVLVAFSLLAVSVGSIGIGNAR
jgi:hypothetical protein